MEIWTDAYDNLRKSNPEMLVIYEKILSSQLITCKKMSKYHCSAERVLVHRDVSDGSQLLLLK